MDIPVTVNEYSVSVSVIDESVLVAVTVNAISINVAVNYGLNATQVDDAIEAKLTKENITGLKLADSPEFADTQITPLATEATYTSTVWTYLVELFTTVPKSVKEHIVKGWTVIENLKSRISFLENNLILSIALTETVASLDINLPTSEYDIEIEVDCTCNTDTAVNASLRINGVSTSDYVAVTTQTYVGFPSYIGRYASIGVYRFVLINGFVFYFCDIQQIWGDSSTQNVAGRRITGFLKVPQTGINKITFAHSINEGSKFVIRRGRRHE